MRILIAIVFFFGLLMSAQAQTKRAFIVGVGEYEQLADLPKTRNDAESYARLFEELGFDVTSLVDPTRADFSEAFGGYLSRISAGDEVVFIFSGHGWSDGAENFLVMSDAPADASEYQLKDETRALQNDILLELKRRNPRLVFAIIDACRNYPFNSFTMSPTSRGLVPTNSYEGTLVLFSAGDRQRALERLGAEDDDDHSVFTRVLLPKLRDTSRPLQEIARDVKDEVRDLALTIQHNQRPAYYDELLGDYCLSGTCLRAPASIDPDTAFWIEITSGTKGENPCEMYRAYEDAFPDGRFRDRAGKLLGTPPCVDDTPSSGSSAVFSNSDKFSVGDEFHEDLENGGRGPTMVVIPSGTFMMGRADNENSTPVHEVTIPKPLAVGKYEVTWGDFKPCIEAGACVLENSVDTLNQEIGPDEEAVDFVTWSGMQTYLKWLSAETGATYRLLSEAEWEYAARAGTTTKYAWGDNEPTCTRGARNGAHFAHSQRDDRTKLRGCHEAGESGFPSNKQVGFSAPNAFGLFDMHGNVMEWVADCYHETYEGAPVDGSAWMSDECVLGVLRGGSYVIGAHYWLQSSARWDAPFDARWGSGFRIAREL